MIFSPFVVVVITALVVTTLLSEDISLFALIDGSSEISDSIISSLITFLSIAHTSFLTVTILSGSSFLSQSDS